MIILCFQIILKISNNAKQYCFFFTGASFFFIMLHAAFYDPLTSGDDGMEEADLEMEEV